MTNGFLHNWLLRLGLSELGAQSVELFVLRPVKILLIVVLAVLASRLAARVTRHFITSVGTRTPLQARSERAPKRANALASTTASVARVVVWALAIPLILGEIGLNLGPFIAGATIIGAALGFGAQSIVKDLLSGFMILSEDQYAVGDSITVGDTSGTVEDVNLLRTRFRADDGKVWFVANGELRKVANSSLGWSRATADLVLPFETDLDAAVEAAADEASKLVKEPEWADAILAPPEVWTDSIKPDGVTVRVVARTRPGQSAGVARALLARVARRLGKGGPAGGPPPSAPQGLPPVPPPGLPPGAPAGASAAASVGPEPPAAAAGPPAAPPPGPS